MDRIYIPDCRFNSLHIFFSKGTADVEIKRRNWRAMINHRYSANDNKFKTAVLESHEQSLVILRHEDYQLPGPLTENQ